MKSKKVETVPERKEYRRPHLKCYGTLVELTQALGNDDSDGALGTMNTGL